MNTQQVMINFLNSMELLIKETKSLLTEEAESTVIQSQGGGTFTKAAVEARKNKKALEEAEKEKAEAVAKAEEEKLKTPVKGILVTTDEKSVFVSSPYNSLFTEEAKVLGGKWIDKKWVFDKRDIKEVKDTVFKIYGEIDDKVNLVDLEVTFNVDGNYDCYQYGDGYCKPIAIFGQRIAEAKGRDGGARLETGIVLKSGGFTSAGSMKNWFTKAKENTTVLLRDISKKLVDEFLSENNNAIKINIIAVNSNVKDTENIKDEDLLDD